MQWECVARCDPCTVITCWKAVSRFHSIGASSKMVASSRSAMGEPPTRALASTRPVVESGELGSASSAATSSPRLASPHLER
jgi:hypothetical protein